MSVLPTACAGPFDGELLPLGTRVRFKVTKSTKTGRPIADNVVPAQIPSQKASRKNVRGQRTKSKMETASSLVLPTSCMGPFKGELSPVCTRVSFVEIKSAKTGRPMTHHVEPAKAHPQTDWPKSDDHRKGHHHQVGHSCPDWRLKNHNAELQHSYTPLTIRIFKTTQLFPSGKKPKRNTCAFSHTGATTRQSPRSNTPHWTTPLQLSQNNHRSHRVTSSPRVGANKHRVADNEASP